jgi:hypothetical protein
MLRQTFRDHFLGHPTAVGETYGEHCRRALRTSLRLFGAAVAAMIHAVVPAWFTTTASVTVGEINDEIQELHALQSVG